MLAAVRACMLREVGSLLLFFGSLSHDTALQQSGDRAVSELRSQGYALNQPNEALRVYPAPSGSLGPHQAGGWKPGILSVRQSPDSDFPAEVYLRHELMHQAMYRTCKARLPLWVQEGSAIHFSGEASVDGELPSGAELESLRRAVATDAPLSVPAYQGLRKLVGVYSWPAEPCAVSPEISQLLKAKSAIDAATPSFIVMSVLSGRILLEEGAKDDRLPLGSLLKVPFAASLSEGDPYQIGTELAKSDTAALLERRDNVRSDVLERLLAPIPKSDQVLHRVGSEGARWEELLGERDSAGDYPLVGSLREAALVMRNSILEQPKRFLTLSQNGAIAGSTLEKAPEAVKTFIRQYRVIAKTGTAANAEDRPLVGNLFFAWPADAPVFLAIIRAGGMRGANVADRAEPVVARLREQFPPNEGRVRFRVMSRLPRADVEWYSPCHVSERESAGNSMQRISACGIFEFRTKAIGARPRRWFRGNLIELDGVLLMETDPETYADDVLDAEAADSKGELRKALRAVIYWNGLYGSARHAEWSGLCDTTHCMVDRGEPSRPAEDSVLKERVDRSLLPVLRKVSEEKQDRWMPFAKGGLERWEHVIPRRTLAKFAAEDDVLEIERERRSGGEVFIHISYPQRSETVPCETFFNRVHLPACPESIAAQGEGWIFRGVGEGHGEGLDLVHGAQLAKEGKTAKEILTDAYTLRAPS